MANTPLNTLGASNLSTQERAINDYYGTDPTVTRALLAKLSELGITLTKIWEPCAGHHLIVNELEEAGYSVRCSDIANYGFNDEILDFMTQSGSIETDIITNPPYKLATEFVEQALDRVTTGHYVIMLLRTLFVEGQKRFEKIFKNNPPKYILVFSKRQVCSAKDDFTEPSAVSYSWFVWEKGSKTPPIVYWL